MWWVVIASSGTEDGWESAPRSSIFTYLRYEGLYSDGCGSCLVGGECSGVVVVKLGVGVSKREGGCLNDPCGVFLWCVVCWLLVWVGGVGLKLGVEVFERFAGLDRSELGDGFRSLLSRGRVCVSLGCRVVGVANALFVRVFCSVLLLSSPLLLS